MDADYPSMGVNVPRRITLPVLFGIIELAGLAIAGDPVALDIAQMRLRALQAVTGELDDARLDDDPALPIGGIAVARRASTP